MQFLNDRRLKEYNVTEDYAAKGNLSGNDSTTHTEPAPKDCLFVIVVDPDPHSRQAVAAHIESLGHDVCVFSNCSEAWEVVQGISFDAAIIDLETPAITAIELARRVQLISPSTRMVATSWNIAGSSSIGHDLCYRNGFAHVVKKAEKSTQLLKQIDKVIAELLPGPPPQRRIG
jgi:CheY-like chemotaxis protein